MKKVIVIAMCLLVAMVGTSLAVVGCGEPSPEEAKEQLETDLLERRLT